MDNHEKRITELEEKVRRLETKKGYCNQTTAAAYCGRSKEYLRERHVRGDGPARMPNGMYRYADLDAWMEKPAA